MDRQQWDERYMTDELIWRAEPNRFLVEEVARMKPGRALDLACGEGRNALWLAERGWQVTGVDFSPVGLAKARRLAVVRRVDVS
jgi:SAM-dependent methyltransferase